MHAWVEPWPPLGSVGRLRGGRQRVRKANAQSGGGSSETTRFGSFNQNQRYEPKERTGTKSQTGLPYVCSDQSSGRIKLRTVAFVAFVPSMVQ
jgi:hypothetical protein